MKWLRHRAFSITEVMIAIALGSMITLLLMTHYLSQKSNYHLQQALIEEQEQARVVFIILQQAIQQAGYRGCAQSAKQDLIIFHQNIPESLKGRAIAGSDILEVHHLDSKMNYLLQDMQRRDALVSNTDFVAKPKQRLWLSSCLQSQEIIVDSVKPAKEGRQTILFHPMIEPTFLRYTMLAPLLSERYYIGRTKRKTIDKQFIDALYVQHANGRSEELVPGVKHLKLFATGEPVNGVAISLSLAPMHTNHKTTTWKSYVALHSSFLSP